MTSESIALDHSELTSPDEEDYKNQPDCIELDHIPGNFGWPFIGNMIEWVRDLRGMVERRMAEHGPVSRINIMGNKGIMVTGPDVMQRILLDKDKNFSNEMGFKKNLGKFFEGGILLRDFDEHKVQRRIFQTAFKNDPMRTYVRDMNAIMEADMDSWRDMTDFVVFPHIKQMLLTTAAKIFVGVERDSPDFKALYTNYINMLNGMTALVQLEVPGLRWHKSQQAKRNINTCFENLIPERRAGDDTDFLSFFCREKMEDGSYFSNEDIIRHMNFLVFAAHDTTTASIINIMYELAKNPEWQERLRKACQDYAAEHNKDALDYDDLNAIPDLEYTMLEGQRMHPSVPMAVRRTIREIEIEGYTIPAHTQTWMPYVAYYRSEKYWTNPDQFDPDRFNPEREEFKQHPFLFIPFGGGAHKCIGMHFAKIQVKCFLYQFLQRYSFSVPEDYNPWLMMVPMPKPADDLPVKLERIAP
jgi:cytochrome P450